jgi:hypothetical protein
LLLERDLAEKPRYRNRDLVIPNDTAGGFWPHYSVNAARLSLPADRMLNGEVVGRRRPCTLGDASQRLTHTRGLSHDDFAFA